jgi:hypothetical protein
MSKFLSGNRPNGIEIIEGLTMAIKMYELQLISFMETFDALGLIYKQPHPPFKNPESATTVS